MYTSRDLNTSSDCTRPGDFRPGGNRNGGNGLTITRDVFATEIPRRICGVRFGHRVDDGRNQSPRRGRVLDRRVLFRTRYPVGLDADVRNGERERDDRSSTAAGRVPETGAERDTEERVVVKIRLSERTRRWDFVRNITAV